MLRRFWLAAAVAGFVACPALAAEETYTIKIKRDMPGETSQTQNQGTEQNHTTVLDGDGNKLNEQKTDRIKTESYRETILEKPDPKKKATRLRRRYEKAEVTSDGKTTPLPYQGKTLLIEKKQGQFHFRVEGGDELTGKDAQELNKEFNDKEDEDFDPEQVLLPKKPVKAGETWKVEPSWLIKSFEKGAKGAIQVDKDKVVSRGKLVRAYKKDGRQFGVIDYHFELPLKEEMVLDKDTKAAVPAGTKFVGNMTLDVCIDGTVGTGTFESVVSLEMTATFKGPDGKAYKLAMAFKQKENSAHKDLGKE
jgi:hypothetical protein